jgi:hypothetical protein
MERMRLIALFGPKRSGKDEAARYLCDAWYATPPWGWRLPAWRAAFADPLRQACDALGLPSATTRGRKDEPCASLDGHPGRAVLVAIGEAVRALACRAK